MVIMGALIGFVSFALTRFERWNGSSAGIALSLLALIATILMLPAVPEMPREVRGNGEMFPLNGPCWSLFFEYIGNILYAFILRKLPTKFLALLAIVLSCGLAWFATTNQSGYGSIGVGWTIDPVNILGGTLRMLCPFTLGLLLNRVFKPIKTKGAFWFCTIVIIVLFHIPYIGINSTISYNGMFESVCIIFIFPAIVFIGASGKTTDNMSNKICGFLGNISFPLYIVHYPIMYVFYRYLIKTKQYSLSQTWPMAIAVVVLSIVLAYVCLKVYDTKMRKWLTKIFLNNQLT